ncbi:MAG: LacI family DNA-binding transcriptional regulator [Bacillota bacterium]
MRKQSKSHSNGFERQVTIVDIAERAGVSIATVSRVLNQTGRYSEETLKRVKATAAELGYAPNFMAKSLKKRQTEQIALAVADIGNPVYVAMAKAIQQVVKEHGYRLVLLSTEARVDEEISILQSLAKQYVDGLIISPLSYGEAHKKQLAQVKRPVVVIGGSPGDMSVDSVYVDSAKGVRMAMEHLLDQGFSQIAFVNGPSETVPGTVRLHGYEEALIEHGIVLDPRLVVHGDFTLSGGHMAAAKLLELPGLPQAVLCANDLMALGVLRRLREAGVRVPEDVALVGMDDIEQARISSPALTTVSLLAAERGRIAAELLLGRLTCGSAEPPRQVTVTPRLIVRESSVAYSVNGGVPA